MCYKFIKKLLKLHYKKKLPINMNENAQNRRIFWSRKIIEFFIHLYKQNECLYDTKHKDFYNQPRRNESCEQMLQKMQTFLPELQIDDIHDKIKAMRDQIANEVSLLEESEAAGTRYVPTLWCFEQLKFLIEHMSSVTTKDAEIEKKEDVWDDPCNDNDDDSVSDSSNSLLSELTNNKLQRKFQWTRDVTTIFIKLFKRYTILYDRNHKNYRNRPKRDEARIKLLKDMNHVDSTITLEDVGIKIKCLRCQFSRERRQIVAAQKKNTIYKPKLWCFDELSFLNNRNIVLKSSHEYDNDDETQALNDNNTTIESDGTNNDSSTINNECLDDEHEIQQIIEEDEVEYDESALKLQNHPIIEIIPNEDNNEFLDEFEQDQHEDTQGPLTKKPRYEEITPNNERDSKHSIQKVLSTESNLKKKRKAPTDNKTGNYEWLGELVVSQMDEISQTFRSDFAWDVQCLIRKYIIKTKEEQEDNPLSSNGAATKKKKSSQDIVLPRSSNVYYSFLKSS